MLNYTIKEVSVNTVRDFIETNHYSHNINGLNISVCFGLYNEDTLIGAALYGRLAMAGTEKKYQALGYARVIELRRLVLVDDTPKNTESWFISRTLRLIRKRYDLVVSYADEEYGHTGVIYKASNFVLYGKTAKGINYLYNGKKYHDKCARTKYKGEYKPFAKRLRAAIASGEAEKVVTKSKYIYLYSLSNTQFRA